jgi:hypothetical protein
VDDAALSDAAKLALDSPAMIQAVALSTWIAESGPRPLTARQVLRRPDIPVAAAVIGVASPEKARTAADVPALNRPWNLALAMGLLRAGGGTVTAGPALATWPPADFEILKAWLDGLLTTSGSEAASPWDDEPPGDILLFLTAVQEAADGVPLKDELMRQATELTERIGLDATFFWTEKRIANTTDRLTSFGAIKDNEVTTLGRWTARRLQEKLAEPGEEVTAAELIACLADRDSGEWDENFWDWLDAQPDQAEAARQVLTAAAPMEPRMRWIAAAVVETLQEEALPVWREMTDVPGIGPHASSPSSPWRQARSQTTVSGSGWPSNPPRGRWPSGGRMRRSPCSGSASRRRSWPPMTWSTAWPWSGPPIIHRRCRPRRPSRTSSRPPEKSRSA